MLYITSQTYYIVAMNIYGIRESIKNNDRDELMAYIDKCYVDISKYYGYPYTVLDWACFNEDYEMIQKIMNRAKHDKRIDPGCNKNSSLRIACSKNNLNIVKYLISCASMFPNINVIEKDYNDNSPISIAIFHMKNYHFRRDIVNYLLTIPYVRHDIRVNQKENLPILRQFMREDYLYTYIKKIMCRSLVLTKWKFNSVIRVFDLIKNVNMT